MKRQTIGTITTSHLGYGGMRFPLDGEGHIDADKIAALIRRAIEGGITYFDTAWPYHQKESEPALGRALAPFPRESYQLATKLPCWEMKSAEEAVACVELQLQRLQTDYVDFYLFHSLNKKTWTSMVQLGVVEAMEELQRQGKIRQFGFSFHDSYETFEEILSARQWDFCQIQLNYMDINHQAGLKGYHLATEKGVPVVIMEPLKGGMLSQLPDEIASPMTSLAPERSISSWGMRWLASLPNIKVILSGMSTLEQIEDNLKTFQDIEPLSAAEYAGVEETTRRIRMKLKNGCTACSYCIPCPAGVDIPQNFRTWNLKAVFGNRAEVARVWALMDEKERANHCIGCGKCETKCPQRIPIRAHLQGLAQEIESYIAETE